MLSEKGTEANSFCGLCICHKPHSALKDHDPLVEEGKALSCLVHGFDHGGDADNHHLHADDREN